MFWSIRVEKLAVQILISNPIVLCMMWDGLLQKIVIQLGLT